MPRKTIAPTETSASEIEADVEIILPLSRRRRTDGDCKAARADAGDKSPTRPTIPRISRLMALAIKFQEMVDHGEVADYADLARLGYVTRARLTQIMNLTLLAPEIQEAILFPTEMPQGRSVGERAWRTLTAEPNWKRQRELAAARNAIPLCPEFPSTRSLK
jgi:hypothetical protein